MIEAILAEYHRLSAGPLPHGTEKDIVRAFRESVQAKTFDGRIPLGEHDTIAYEMSLKFGRADIVVFHVDGTASVIEVKDGANGYAHVVAGIGQAALYAAQLATRRLDLRRVRRCLLWSSTGDVFLDAVIEQACEEANTIALPWPSVQALQACRIAATAVVTAARG